jgi:hypothetical protein
MLLASSPTRFSCSGKMAACFKTTAMLEMPAASTACSKKRAGRGGRELRAEASWLARGFVSKRSSLHVLAYILQSDCCPQQSKRRLASHAAQSQTPWKVRGLLGSPLDPQHACPEHCLAGLPSMQGPAPAWRSMQQCSRHPSSAPPGLSAAPPDLVPSAPPPPPPSRPRPPGRPPGDAWCRPGGPSPRACSKVGSAQCS